MNEDLRINIDMLLSTRLVLMYLYFVTLKSAKNELIPASHRNKPNGDVSSSDPSGNLGC